MMYPKVWSWKDALTFGLAALLLTVGAVLAWCYPSNELVGKLVCTFLAVLSWGPFLYRLWQRWRAAKAVSFTTAHGLMVNVGPYGDFLTREVVEEAVEATVQRWAAVGIQAALTGWYMVWKPRPFEYRNVWYNGLVQPECKQITVGFWKPITETALAHEVGHVIYGVYKKTWSEAEYQAFAAEKGLA